MRHLFEPRLVNDAFGDPGLYVDFRDERRALLFDLGDITRLPPRKLLRLSHVFVTHAHMDHFAGFDHLLRVVLGRKAQIALTGGPGFVAQVEHKLRAYTWNVVHRYEVALTIDVCEVGADGGALRARFSSRTGFEREPAAAVAPAGDVLHDETAFRVRGRFVDHGIPCLAYAVEEKARVSVGKDRVAALGLGDGRVAARAEARGADGRARPIRRSPSAGATGWASTRRFGRSANSRHLVLGVAPGRRIGYVTDLRYSEANVATLSALLAGVDLLFIESVFLDEDADHAERKHHLTARQAGLIARRVGARSVVPFHHSPRYEGRAAELVAEVNAAWSGAPATPGRPAAP